MPTRPDSHPQVGPPDPDGNTSPIVGEDEDVAVEAPSAAGLFYFNDTAYVIGSQVQSGREVLRCEAPGVWVRLGELPPGARVLD